MIPEERYQRILEMLKANGSVASAELSSAFHTSYETIRRDLHHLEKAGKLRRTAGGAVISEVQSSDALHYTGFASRYHQHTAEKEEISQLALQYIHDGDPIALDSGTTALELARALKGKFRALTVVTNSLAIANELADAQDLTLIVTGGIYKPDESSFISEIAEAIFSKISIRTFFLTTCGLSVEKGVTYQRMDEMSVQLQMMNNADRTIALADSSKLGVNSLFKMCDIDQISVILTDRNAAKEKIRPFLDHGIPVVGKSLPLS